MFRSYIYYAIPPSEVNDNFRRKKISAIIKGIPSTRKEKKS